ncbi:uncharacterized protein PG986_005026 [Apiospora aurea]|uniref:Uncharacterized protein n=1 Tax=Apiospora aurea TaxID=335848 RepID=A0ABR1QGE2_9PEZI
MARPLYVDPDSGDWSHDGRDARRRRVASRAGPLGGPRRIGGLVVVAPVPHGRGRRAPAAAVAGRAAPDGVVVVHSLGAHAVDARRERGRRRRGQRVVVVLVVGPRERRHLVRLGPPRQPGPHGHRLDLQDVDGGRHGGRDGGGAADAAVGVLVPWEICACGGIFRAVTGEGIDRMSRIDGGSLRRAAHCFYDRTGPVRVLVPLRICPRARRRVSHRAARVARRHLVHPRRRRARHAVVAPVPPVVPQIVVRARPEVVGRGGRAGRQVRARGRLLHEARHPVQISRWSKDGPLQLPGGDEPTYHEDDKGMGAREKTLDKEGSAKCGGYSILPIFLRLSIRDIVLLATTFKEKKTPPVEEEIMVFYGWHKQNINKLAEPGSAIIVSTSLDERELRTSKIAGAYTNTNGMEGGGAGPVYNCLYGAPTLSNYLST